MRALPEKTLEHWVSRDVARRFPNANLWWPSNGEDIMVDELTGRPGKWFMLEVKTTEWEPTSGKNRLTIDLEQLREYLATGMPIFYVFPVPPWDGVLTSARPWLGRWRRGDLGNLAAGNHWFAHWTYVLPAREVASLIGTTWTKNKSGTLFTSSVSNRLRKIPNGARTLNQFLSLLTLCGDPRSQAGFVAPRVTPSARPVLRTDLAAQLRALVLGEGGVGQPVAHYLPMPGNDNVDRYQEVEVSDLSESLAAISRGSAQLLTVSVDATDLGVI